VREPLSDPGLGFWHLEVTQVEVVEGRAVLVFSCLGEQQVPTVPRGGGVWTCAVDSPTGPYDVRRARLVTGDDLYAGRIVQRRDGGWVLLAFRNLDAGGRFVGEISDPIPVGWVGDVLRPL
jgi:beta-fructofuranosidase